MFQSLVTAEQRSKLQANARAFWSGEIEEIEPVVRLLTPNAHATWLLATLDATDGDTAYGLCDLGLGRPWLGQIRLSDLAAIAGPARLPVMRDLYFRPTR
ncbi:DUF2958 domain-containing protein [Cupriavidus pauculus]|uniref:DUF2958 domain-containing protein n=1 Tax=Cupriavidus pauculus TaxID=82633 RepID=A0A2N5C6R9_9BURK|nr:DUF2958 domain-containing protein [Cupriavidus pauculus]PLP97921.1 hypothetical protein CYJ10_24270 [Cupriavidus pauculus]